MVRWTVACTKRRTQHQAEFPLTAPILWTAESLAWLPLSSSMVSSAHDWEEERLREQFVLLKRLYKEIKARLPEQLHETVKVLTRLALWSPHLPRLLPGEVCRSGVRGLPCGWAGATRARLASAAWSSALRPISASNWSRSTSLRSVALKAATTLAASYLQRWKGFGHGRNQRSE